MTARELKIPGAWEITPALHADGRGLFFEWFTDTAFTAMTGHHFDLAQANCSVSAAGVLRGVHFSELPPSQAKYVTCVRGAVFDVVVDLRRGSSTFGRWLGIELSAANRRELWIPPGCAHGFLSLADDTVTLYKTTAGYSPRHERCIRWDDPALAIAWPLAAAPLLSPRDAEGLALADAEVFP